VSLIIKKGRFRCFGHVECKMILIRSSDILHWRRMEMNKEDVFPNFCYHSNKG